MSKSLQRGILFSICVALVLALSLTLVFFAGGGDKNILSAPQGQVSATAQNTTSYTHGSNIKRHVPSGVKTVSNGLAFITAVSDNESVSLAGDITLAWNQFGIQAEGISGGWSVDTYTGTIYGNGYTVTFDGLNTTSEVYPASGFNYKAYAGGIVRELGSGGAIYDLNVVVDGHIRVLGASGQYLDLGILVGQMNSNSTIDNCTVTVNNGKSVESMKMSSSILWARLGLFVGKFADNASNMRITNVTATHNGTIEVGLGTTSGLGGTAGGGNTDESAQGFAGLIFGAASKSATNITLDNIVVAGSGVIWSYAGAPIGMLMGNTAVTINNFFNKTTNGSLFKAIQDNRMSNTILDWGRNGDNVQGRVVNHYRSSQAQQATADDNNGINVTNTITVSNDNIGKIYFDPTVSDYANSLTIVHDTSNPPVDSANERTYTITGQNGYSATSTEIVDNGGNDRVIFENLSSTASNWNNGGNFGYNVTYKDTPIFQIPDDDPILFYEHGYTATQSTDGTPISSGDDWLSHFGQNASGGGDSRSPLTGNYYLTKDIVISGFSDKFFNGTFDGNGHTIYIIGVSQDSYDNPGIGGVIGTLMRDGTIGGTIKNMRVVLVNELTVNGPSNGRVGGVVGHIQGGTLENVTVLYDDTAALISETTSNDITIGGVAGRATANAQIKNVTLEMESGSRLAPKSGWTYLAGVVGIIDAANGATFKNIVLRGTGNFNADSDNDNQPPYYAAIANTKAEGYNGSDQYASINGLIYDFTAQLNGTFNGSYGEGQDHCSMYYLFSNNWHNGSGSVGSYHNLVSYSNIFIAEGKGGELAENVGDRFSSSSGNAPIMIESDTTPYTIARNVSSAMNRYDDARVTAYFQPVDVTIGSDYNYAVGDLVLKVSGHNWQEDESLMVNVGGDTGKVISYLEDPNNTSSDRIVKLTKDQAVMAATNNSNTVQVSDFLHVAQPQLANELTYTGSGIDVTFVVRYESESGSAQMGEELPNTAYTVSIKKKEGGTGSVVDGKPVNAGEYVATITLTKGDKFIASGTGSDTDTATVEFTVAPFVVQGTWALNDELTLTYGDAAPVDINQYIEVTLPSQIPGGLNAVKAEGFTTNYTQGTAAGTTVNVTKGTFVIEGSFTASNYDLSGITGSGSVQVQKKELTITNLGDDASHITDSYGSNVTSLEDLATLFETEGMSYVQGIYENQAVTFTITAFTYDRSYDDGADGALEEGADATSLISGRLYAKTYYTATVTLASDNAVNDNYELAEGSTFVYYIEPLVIEITGAEFAGGGTSVLYDGNAHEIQVVYKGALDGDNLTFTTNVFYNSESFEGTQLTNAGSYEVTIGFDPQNAFHGDPEYNYDIVSAPDEVRYTLTITPVTLTINDISGNYTDYTVADIVIDDMVSGILEGDSEGVTIDVVWDTTPADENGYLAAGTYNATLSLSGDKAVNYTFGSDNVATVTVSRFNLSGAQVTITSAPFTYNGNEQTVLYTVLTAEGGKDITALLTPAGNTQTNAGDNYTLTLTGGSSFTGSATANWSIAKKDVTFEWSVSGEIVEGMAVEDVKAMANPTNNGGILEADTYTFGVDIGDYTAETPRGTQVTFTPSVTFTEEGDADNYNITFSPETEELIVQLGEVEIGVTQDTVNADYVNGYTSAADFLANFTTSVPEVAIDGENFTVTVTPNDGGDAAVGFGSLLDVGEYTVTLTSSVYNNLTGTTTYAYQVTATVAEISWAADTDLIYNGAPHTLTATVANKVEQDDVTVTVQRGSGNNVNVTAEGFTFTATGLTGAAAGNYTIEGAVNLISDVKTITPATLNITQTAEETLTRPYDGTTTEATSFLTEKYVTITGGVSGENIYGMLNASLTEGGEIKNAGAYTITVTFNSAAEGAGNYSVGKFTSLEIVYTVTAKTITITFDGYEGLTYNGQARTLTATADFVSGENIDLNALIAYTGNVTDGKAVNAGSYTATITKAQIKESNANYTLAAESATQEFTISPATLTLTQKEGAQLSRVYDGTVTEAGAFVSADYFTVSGYMDDGNVYALFTAAVAEGLTIQNADSYTINITINSGAEGAGNYVLAEDATVEFTIAPKSIGVAWENTAFTYNGLAQVPTANVGEAQGLVAGDDLQITVSGAETDANTDGGSYTATAAITGGEDMGNYVLAENATIGFTIAPKPIGVEWTNTAFEYDGAPHKPTATATGLVGDDSLTLTVTGEQTNAGSYTATVEAASVTGNYKLAEDATIEFTIAPKSIGVKWTNTAFEYNGSAQVPTATATDLVGGDSLTLTVTGEQTNAGSYTATVAAFEQGNYKLAKDATIEFTIAPKPITITFTANDSANPINFDVAGSVTVGETWTIDGGNAGRATLVLSDGTTDITLTVEAASGEALPTTEENVPALLLLLDRAPYEGTPYGTEVKGGSLTVISADTNYVFKGAQEITLNITPAIIVGLQADVQTKLGLTDVLKTDHNADYFKDNYFKVTGKDGAEVTGGTLKVTITTPEGVELPEGVIKHAGTYTVKAVYTPAGAGDGAEKPTYSFKFIVTPVEVMSVTYSGEPLVYGDLRASGEIAVTVEYADGKKAENVTAQYTSEHVSTGNWLKAGNTQVTVSYTGDNRDYAAVTEHVITLTVAQKTITATINYGEQSGTELTLTYNGSVGYTIGAELNDVLSGDGVGAEVRESFIDVAASPYEVVITLAGIDSDNYKVVGKYTVTITPADVTYEWNFDGAITYGDSVEDVTALAVMPDGALLGVEEKVAFQVSVGDYSATTNAGTEVTFTVTAKLPDGAKEKNYNIIITAADGNTLTVGKATLNLTIAESASLTKVYDGKAVTLGSLLTADNVSVKGMKNGEDAFTLGILVINGTTQEITNVGEMSGSVTVKDDSNYAATALTVTYEITPKPIGVAWTNTEFTYDGTAKMPTATAAGLVEGDSLTLTVSGAETDAGSYTATVKAFVQGNYKLESTSTQTFTIKKAAAALAIKDYDAIQASVYKGSAFVVTPLLNGAEDTQGIVEVKFVDKTDSSETVAVQEIKNAGVYTVTLTVNNANYEYAQSHFTVTVSPKSIVVAWGDTAFTYNGSAQVPTATATGLVDGDSLTLVVTGAQMNAGSYEATVKAASVTGNYKLEKDITQTFTIAKADLTVTPASLEIRERETEDMQAFAEGEDLAEAFAGRISVSGVSGTVSYTVTIAGDNNYDDEGLLTVGAHTFTIDAGGNYNAASVSVTVIATPVVTVIASVEGELVYNGSAFEISYALKEGAPEDVSMDDITVTASVETIVNAGEYEVIFTVTGSNEDYDYVVQDASGNAALTFTIARRGLDVAEVAEAVYGGLQVSGTLVTGTHTAFVAYNDEEIELIVNVKTAALSRAAAEYLDAGEYEVTIALADENGNFSLNGATLNAETQKMEVQSTLDVAPKTIEVGYTTSSGVYDAKGISVTIDKFEDMLIEGDDPAVNIYINDALYTGKVVLDAGEYTVRYESADPNYAFEPVSATFTVAPKSVTPNFDLNTGSGSQQITGGGKLEIEEGEETDIVAAIDNFMQSSGVSEEDMSIAVSGDLKLEDMATWAPGTYTVTVTLSGNHSGSMQFTVEVSEKIELPPPVAPELPETPVEAGSGNDWVLPLVIAIVALIDLALLVAIGVAAKKRA